MNISSCKKCSFLIPFAVYFGTLFWMMHWIDTYYNTICTWDIINVFSIAKPYDSITASNQVKITAKKSASESDLLNTDYAVIDDNEDETDQVTPTPTLSKVSITEAKGSTLTGVESADFHLNSHWIRFPKHLTVLILFWNWFTQSDGQVIIFLIYAKNL